MMLQFLMCLLTVANASANKATANGVINCVKTQLQTVGYEGISIQFESPAVVIKKDSPNALILGRRSSSQPEGVVHYSNNKTDVVLKFAFDPYDSNDHEHRTRALKFFIDATAFEERLKSIQTKEGIELNQKTLRNPIFKTFRQEFLPFKRAFQKFKNRSRR